MQTKIDKDAWVAMFKEIGLSDQQMKQWHQLFEKRHPESHEEFLSWLGISSKEVAKIRAMCK